MTLTYPIYKITAVNPKTKEEKAVFWTEDSLIRHLLDVNAKVSHQHSNPVPIIELTFDGNIFQVVHVVRALKRNESRIEYVKGTGFYNYAGFSQDYIVEHFDQYLTEYNLVKKRFDFVGLATDPGVGKIKTFEI